MNPRPVSKGRRSAKIIKHSEKQYLGPELVFGQLSIASFTIAPRLIGKVFNSMQEQRQ
jgi:hypothetical protein